MQTKQPINGIELLKKKLGNKINNFILPPPIFTIMQCEFISYDEIKKSLIIKLPVLKKWCNVYGTMQGGMIDAAIDNAVGPLSMLLLSKPSITRTIETKFLKAIEMKVKYIYIKTKLIEEKKRRLTFEASVEDVMGVVYAKSKLINFIL